MMTLKMIMVVLITLMTIMVMMMTMMLTIVAMSHAYDDNDKMSPTGVSKAKGVCELDHRRGC